MKTLSLIILIAITLFACATQKTAFKTWDDCINLQSEVGNELELHKCRQGIK